MPGSISYHLMPVGRNIHFVDAGIEPGPFEPFALQVTATSITQPPVSLIRELKDQITHLSSSSNSGD